MSNLRAGFIKFQINGNVYDASGSFTYNLGAKKRTTLLGPDKVHGYKEMPQVPFIAGAIRDGSALDVRNELLDATNATLTLTLASGKVIMLESAWFALEGDAETEEGTIAIRFEGMSCTEIAA
jgi:hypothetical protein